jgi:probable HAF family extracellular repeat protein
MLCIACLGAVCQAQVRYRVVTFPSSLGNLPLVNTKSLSNTHAIVGTTATPHQPFVWINGKVKILPTLGGATGFGDQANSKNHAVGSTTLATGSNLHATMWIGKQVINLDQFGGVSSSGNVINNLDQVAGAYDPGDSTEHAYFLTSTGWTGIGDLGGSYTFTFGLNDAGMVTGQSDTSNTPDPVFGIPPFHGYVWQNGELTDFGSVFGDDFNTANYVNAAGQIIGSSDLANNFYAHAFLYDHGTITDLLTLPGDQISWGLGINNVGQIVGTSGLRDPDQQDGPPLYSELCPCHAVLWQNGKVIDLGKHVPSQYSLELALAITDDGVILAKTELPELAYVLLVPMTPDSPDDPVLVETGKNALTGPRLLKRGPDGSITAVH